MKMYKIELKIAIRDPETVIQKAKQLLDPNYWNELVEEVDGDELFVAVDAIFSSSHLIPDDLMEAVDYFASGCETDGEIPLDWAKQLSISLLDGELPQR
jgi:hypothetical protein